jgi:anti-sigma regulatory factor (Ser/Thr protein kinase)
VGEEAEGVLFVDMAECGHNPARIIPAWLRFLEHHGPDQPVRGIGEPIWAGRRPSEIEECQLHEVLLNLAVDPDVPLWLQCPYDADALDPTVLLEAHRSHPILVDADGGYAGSTTYGGAHHALELFSGRLPEPPCGVEKLPFTAATLGQVPEFVRRRAGAAALSEAQIADLSESARELAVDSVSHGGGAGTARCWQARDAFICEIWDAGHVNDLLAGRSPGASSNPRLSLWRANAVSDLLQVRSGAGGTTVRVHAWLASGSGHD